MIYQALQIAVPFVWIGMIGAISFMEAPLKFTAPGITTALGVGIGRIVFQTLNKIEIVLAILLLISIFFKRPQTTLQTYIFAVILIILLLQTFWLLPTLDARALKVMAGEPVEPSSAHLIYIILEVAKFLSLFIFGSFSIKENLRS